MSRVFSRTNEIDMQYIRSLIRISDNGTHSTDRTGVGTQKVFDVNYNIDVSPIDDAMVLPAITTRQVFPRSSFEELCWYLRGSTNVSELSDKGIHIWNGNSSREFLDKSGLHSLREGFIGKAYGHQFRNLGHVDQFKEVVRQLMYNPNSRRIMINLWNVEELHEMALTPCAYCYNFMVEGNTLHLKLIQRSGDMILGVPANIMLAVFFQNFLAKLLGFTPGRFAHSITDAHIYSNLMETTSTLISRWTNPKFTRRVSAYDLEIPDLDLFNSIPVNDFDRRFEVLESIIAKMNYEDCVKNLEYVSDPALPKSMLVMAI